MQPDIRETRLDPRKQPLEPVDLQLRMDATLHQNARPAHLFRLANLVVDLVELEDVSLGRKLALQRPIKCAKKVQYSVQKFV